MIIDMLLFYFSNFVLDISDGFHDMGHVRWQTALALIGAWTLVCLCLIKGIKSQGKVRTCFQTLLEKSTQHLKLSVLIFHLLIFQAKLYILVEVYFFGFPFLGYVL
jgi:hypothetical protein